MNGRALHLQCAGTGHPTVVLEAGAGADGISQWQAVQPAIARLTRVCAYDRAGVGQSAPVSGRRTAQSQVDDLQTLLRNAKLAGPYVLVGFSWGGLVTRLFAGEHPNETAGMVFVDGLDPDCFASSLEALQPFDPSERSLVALLRQGMPSFEGLDMNASFAQARGVRRLGSLPLVVLTHGRSDVPATYPARARKIVETVWLRLQDAQTLMSSDAVHAVAVNSDHAIPLLQPGLVIDAVRAVVRSALANQALPACPIVFPTPQANCRT